MLGPDQAIRGYRGNHELLGPLGPAVCNPRDRPEQSVYQIRGRPERDFQAHYTYVNDAIPGSLSAFSKLTPWVRFRNHPQPVTSSIRTEILHPVSMSVRNLRVSSSLI
jgi:hypothetical protein